MSEKQYGKTMIFVMCKNEFILYFELTYLTIYTMERKVLNVTIILLHQSICLYLTKNIEYELENIKKRRKTIALSAKMWYNIHCLSLKFKKI